MREQQAEKTDPTADARADRKNARAEKKAGRRGRAKKAAAVVGDGTNRVRTLIARTRP